MHARLSHLGGTPSTCARMQSPLVTSLLVLALGTSVHADPLFGPKTDFATGSSPSSVAIGDLNGDGNPDLTVANRSDNTLSVLLGNGDGSFGTRTDYHVADGGVFSVAIGDLNADGNPDLVATFYGVPQWWDLTPGGVGVLLGNGDGTFGPTTTFGAPDPRFVTIGDLNGDGKTDLAVGGHLPGIETFDDVGIVWVLLGNGDGSFGAAAGYSSEGGGVNSVAIGDLNADGKPDLATADTVSPRGGYPGWVSVFLGNGDRSFGAGSYYFDPGYGAASVAIGDLNGDRKLDLAVVSHSFAVENNVVSVLLGNGDGTFGAQTYVGTGDRAGWVTIRDLNADGTPDLAVSNRGSNTVSVLLGNGDGSFAMKSDYVTGSNPRSGAVGDLNGDGKPDLAVSNAGSNTVSVLLNIGFASCAAPMSFDLTPNTLNLRSNGRWVTGVLEPEPPASPADIDVASIRLNGSVPVDASAPTSIGDTDHDGRPGLTVKFDRAAVEMALEEGDAVTVTVSGTIGSSCFETMDVIRVIHAHAAAPRAGSVPQGGSTTGARSDARSGPSGTTLGLALRGLGPNPGRTLRVSFTLPDASPATLAVYDVSGREVSRQEVGGLGLGSHVVTMGTGQALAPGIYFVHLNQRDRQLVARAIVVR